MSRWTHVHGCLRLSASILGEKKNKKGNLIQYIPFPEDQFFLGPAELNSYYNGSRVIYSLDFDVYEYSLPRVKPLIDGLIKDIMPQGELKLNYFLNQQKGSFNSACSSFDSDHEKKLFKNNIVKYYSPEHKPYSKLEFNYLKSKNNIQLGWVHKNDEFTLTLEDSIRYCSGVQLTKSLESLILKLDENNIHIESGVIEWEDESIEEYYFQFKEEDDRLKFSMLNKKDNSIKAFRIYFRNWDTDKLEVEESENWKDFVV